MNPMNKQSLKERLAHYKNSPVSLILLILVLICAALTVITLIFIVIYTDKRHSSSFFIAILTYI